MSWTSPDTVASTILPRLAVSAFSISGSRWATAFFMVSADLRTKGSCISPLAKRSPTTFIPLSRNLLMMSSGLWPISRAWSRSSMMLDWSPSTMRLGRRSSTVNPS